MKKQSKASKIRVLLAEGMSVKDIADKLNYTEAYVGQVKCHWKKTAKQKPEKKAKKAKAKKSNAKLITAAKEADNIFDFLRFDLLRKRAEDDAAMSIASPLFGDAKLKHEGTPWTDDPYDPNASKDAWGLDLQRDMVNSPSHYTAGGIETIDFIEAKKLGYHLGNVVKYVSRAPHKGKQLEDLKKARWYLDREIENLEGVDVFGIAT